MYMSIQCNDMLLWFSLTLQSAEGETAVSITDSTFSWDSEDSDPDKATLKK